MKPPRLTVPHPQLRVLVVDDDWYQGGLLASALVQCGAGSVVHVDDGVNALNALAEPGQRFDLLILDIGQAGMDCTELLRHSADYQVAAVGLASALGQPALDAAAALALAGGHPVIAALRKPIGIEAVAGALARIARSGPELRVA